MKAQPPRRPSRVDRESRARLAARIHSSQFPLFRPFSVRPVNRRVRSRRTSRVFRPAAASFSHTSEGEESWQTKQPSAARIPDARATRRKAPAIAARRASSPRRAARRTGVDALMRDAPPRPTCDGAPAATCSALAREGIRRRGDAQSRSESSRVISAATASSSAAASIGFSTKRMRLTGGRSSVWPGPSGRTNMITGP